MTVSVCNVNIFTGGAFRHGGIEFDEHVLRFGQDVRTGIDGAGGYLIPGLVDIHTHGCAGCDAGDGDPVSVHKMGTWYLKHGVTAWCPTMTALPEPDLLRAVRAVSDYGSPEDGAKMAGIHLEGPFLNPERCGAQPAGDLLVPDPALMERVQKEAGGLVRLVTVAPELDGAEPFIRRLSGQMTVSVGHTNADYSTAMRAFEAGASHATHLYNAMAQFRQREPGVPGAVFDSDVTAEIIPDGLHVHPSVIRMTHAWLGKRMVLVSDSIRCAGMPEGEYSLAGQKVEYSSGKAVLSGTETLAGSSIPLLDGLRRCVSFGIPLEDAVRACTETPADVIREGDRFGRILEGRSADLVLLDRDLKIMEIYRNGRRCEL